MGDETAGGVVAYEAKAGVAVGVDLRGLYTVDPVTGERRYGDGARLSADGTVLRHADGRRTFTIDGRRLYEADPGAQAAAEMRSIRDTFEAARAKSPPLDAAYLAMEARRLEAQQRALERDLPFPLRRPSEPKPIADMPLELRIDGVVLAFRPQRDISAYDLAMVWKLWMLATAGQGVTGVLDWLAANDLLRHFEVAK